MLPIDHLMLDAKQALLEEQHRKFQALQREGRLDEAMRHFHATLSCASDLLAYSLQVLERVLTSQQNRPGAPPTDASAP